MQRAMQWAGRRGERAGAEGARAPTAEGAHPHDVRLRLSLRGAHSTSVPSGP